MEQLTKPRAGSRRNVHPDKTPKVVEPTDNGLDAESFLVWVGKLRQENALFEIARKRHDKVRKLAKNSGMEMGILDRVLKDADKDPDIVLRAMATYKQYSEWLDAPGRQMSLFEIPNSSMLSHEERAEKASRTGYTLGLMGKDPDTQAFPADNEFHQLHMEGWHKGQKILLDKIQPIDISINAADKPAAEDEGERPDPDAENEPDAEAA